MLLLSSIKKTLFLNESVTPILIHVFMVLAVAAYTILGALIMQYIENSHIYSENLKNGYMTAPGNDEWRMKRDLSSENSQKMVLRGQELSILAPDLHNCVANSLAEMMDLTMCNEVDINRFVITPIDYCYKNARIVLNSTKRRLPTPAISGKAFSRDFGEDSENEDLVDPWSFANAVVFSYTVITTIGYGNVAPVTFWGRLFCIFYGLIGIPLALLTVADIGMFLSKVVKNLIRELDKFYAYYNTLFRKRYKSTSTPSPRFRQIESEQCGASEELCNENGEHDEDEESEPEEEMHERSSKESIALAVIFFVYLIVGAFVISLYEQDMTTFNAFYFIFVSCTTVGLGDLVPKSSKYLIVTFIYITIGLALTTMTVEIAAEYLKKLHYFGKKIEGVAHVEVWFGGKKMKLKNLIKHLGDQLNVPLDEMDNLNIDNFVDSAIKVTEGEIKSLRKPEVELRPPRPLSYRDLRKSGEASIYFADERSSIVNVIPSEKQASARTTLNSNIVNDFY